MLFSIQCLQGSILNVSAINVDKDRYSAKSRDRACRRQEAVCGSNHFIARTHSKSHKHNQQRVGSGRDTYRMAAAAIFGNVALECFDFRTEDKLLRFHHTIDGFADFGAD